MELSPKTIEHFRNPKNVGEIENPEGTGDILNPVCGDKTVLYLRIREGVIEDAKFLSFGCAVTIASASVFTEKIKGQRISELLSGTDEGIIRQLISLIEGELGEIPPAKLHCPPATVQVFLEAVSRYLEKEGEAQMSSRIKGLIPKVSEYYQRGEKAEEAV
ncbi:MAG: iron-sulfur cluster assembly scaffold protein [Syntrophaceae bacterium]|nr:iron-sulfur cluster assembly scaffold protein [Syntrophaceae bacterium]